MSEETRSAILGRGEGRRIRLRQGRIAVVEGPSRGAERLLGDVPLVIGRDPGADLRLEDAAVSRRHLAIETRGEAYAVRDLGSRTGTFLGARRVGDAELADGDRIRVGDSLLEFRAETSEVPVGEAGPEGFEGLLGRSPAMRELFGLIATVAPLDLSVLLLGESGTGKEGLARALHSRSSRSGGPYQVVDCTLLSGDHLRSELFGHRRGAFTGAEVDRPGAFARADGGTVFLDELGELPLALQPTLLRVLETGEVRPLGSDDPCRVSVRVVAATSRDLASMVAAGSFRRDLWYRLSGVTVTVPALRDRGEDAALLAEHFLPPGARMSRWARQAVLTHGWPGNVRQLRFAVERAAALAGGRLVEAADLGLGDGTPEAAGAVHGAGSMPTGPSDLEAVESEAIRRALEAARGNRSLAARRLGIARSTLYEKLKRLGLDGPGEGR